jgi:hypothetical protein
MGNYLCFVDPRWCDFIFAHVFDLKNLRITWSGQKLPEFSGLIIERLNDRGTEGMSPAQLYVIRQEQLRRSGNVTDGAYV